MAFERGFKAWCERFAAAKREELGLKPSAPLDAFELAKNLDIQVWNPKDVPGITPTQLAVLLRENTKLLVCRHLSRWYEGPRNFKFIPLVWPSSK